MSALREQRAVGASVVVALREQRAVAVPPPAIAWVIVVMRQRSAVHKKGCTWQPWMV